MRILLAGATGAIGRQLLPKLRTQGHRVTALTRSADRCAHLRDAGAEPVVADVYDAPVLAKAVAAAEPDVVIHQLTDLADVDMGANSRIRQVGSRHLVDAALAVGVRRIIAQSIAWAYQPGEHPAAEKTRLDLESADRAGMVAGVTALEGAAAELPEWVVLRYGQFYGPGTWYAPDGRFATAARAGELPTTADVVSFVHVADAADAAVAALDWPSGAVNVCDDEPAPGSDWVPVFCRAVGAPPPQTDPRPRTPWARGADNSLARSFGWRPGHRNWRDGFAPL